MYSHMFPYLERRPRLLEHLNVTKSHVTKSRNAVCTHRSFIYPLYAGRSSGKG